jgi:hypothetical protein
MLMSNAQSPMSSVKFQQRSGTAPSLMYGEAQSSESRKDFIHKMRLPLKEL